MKLTSKKIRTAFPDKKKKIALLDKLVSEYTRLVYSERGLCRCYTCDKMQLIKEIQCGHYLSRRHISIRWDEDNVRPQCKACNLFNQGMQAEFHERLIRDIGRDRVELLKIKRNSRVSLDDFKLNAMIREYRDKIKECKTSKELPF